MQRPLSQRDLERLRPDCDVRCGRRRGGACFRRSCRWGLRAARRFSSSRSSSGPGSRRSPARLARAEGGPQPAETSGTECDRKTQKRPARPGLPRSRGHRSRVYGARVYGSAVCGSWIYRRPPLPVRHEHPSLEASFSYTKVGSPTLNEEPSSAPFTQRHFDAKNVGHRVRGSLRRSREVALLRQAMSIQMNRTARLGSGGVPRTLPGRAQS